MTRGVAHLVGDAIIPYQELLGNYDGNAKLTMPPVIIPYQELLGNYDPDCSQRASRQIIPYQELLGNYDTVRQWVPHRPYYTIPRAIREL